ncbi:MAG TPA: sulfotransferase [Devosia sp.]|nr:sulfotransferase [Devosia sp.]
MIVILPPDLASLSMLASARQKASDYYAPLLDSDDEVLKVGAWCALLDREEITVEQYPRVIELASHGAIQRRAFRFFQANWEHQLAAQVASKVATSAGAARALAMRADLACDDNAAVEAQRYRFLATGRFDALVAMVTQDERAKGWRAALALAAKVFILSPHDPIAANLVLQLLQQARQTEWLQSVLELLTENNLHPYMVVAYSAALSLMLGDAEGCLATLRQLDAMRPPRMDIFVRVKPMALRLHAEALEATGDYKGAYEAFVALKREEPGEPARLEDFSGAILAAAARNVPELPPDANRDHFVMTGFPRSGTTLLENALAAHPEIETFEEIPSNASMDLYLQRALPAAQTEEALVKVYLEARARYYDEAFRRKHKLGARLFVDKLPMRSAEAAFMSRAFPDKRYIFSIRHPFDVVLSAFRQHFSSNIAMDQFRTFEGAVKLYDFTMTQWFSTYTLEDRRVLYVRYDTLVTEFEATLRKVLTFLGAEWNNAVLDFADVADNRPARTPSYQKVRQGLSIGIQSQWRNYGFLFQSPQAEPLRRWARFFGYVTE